MSSSLAELTLADGKHLKARLVIGADGAKSRIRQLAGAMQSRNTHTGRSGTVLEPANFLTHASSRQEACRFLLRGGRRKTHPTHTLISMQQCENSLGVMAW